MKNIDVESIFKAKASDFYETMARRGHIVGYKIPDYQRNYDWNDNHIYRLIVDCLNGFHRLSENERNSGESYTFLGTLILFEEKDNGSGFDRTSLSVVDGQQRLTTLVLIACALIENISITLDEVLPKVATDKKFTNKIKKWLMQETKYQLERLYECTTGQQSDHGKDYPYPKIIRESDGDTHALGIHGSEYKSAIASFLKDFSNYYHTLSSVGGNNHEFKLPNINDSASERLVKNYKIIKRKIRKLSVLYEDESFKKKDTEFLYVSADKFLSQGIKGLFYKLKVFKNDTDKKASKTFISKNKIIEPLIRLLLFASYMREFVILTRIKTSNEKLAFDIFYSLNTTGEPLTAIQTLKPLVLRFDQKRHEYRGRYEDAYERINKHLDDRFPDPGDYAKRQNESNELVISFALYINGEKLPTNLNNQRSYLRKTYLHIPDDTKHSFIEYLADVATFRHHCWDRACIDSNEAKFSSNNRDTIQLCLRFIADMKTSLATPILCRYWFHITKTSEEDDFLNALKALTAFIVIRRAATGGTAGIDSVLRSLMKKKPTEFEGDPLSAGLDGKNTLWSVENLKVALRNQLKQKVPDVTSKQKWIDKVREIPLARQSKPLARFMLLAAAHGAAADPKTKGLWSRDKIRPDPDKKYLSYDKWIDPKLSTLEHVAPVANSGKDEWNIPIYQSQYTKDTLGNLLLLPAKENTSISNAGWGKKRLFYRALTEKTPEGLKSILMKADKKGFKFKKSVEAMLQDGERLPFLDPIRDVDDWTKDFIEKRTDNIAGLAWETIKPWLWGDGH